ncbi:hypothetical protein OF83DRAFT_1294536 [Amylostereum chailletii]|nr:hypothetical protein OF83DRAFT_1294536 [Amylostereum chailletii]
MSIPVGMFSPLTPGRPVATLLLIENSQPMFSRWPDLRDHYLPNLLGSMRVVNPVVPIQVLWLTSCLPPPDAPASSPPPPPPLQSSRQFNQLPELRFNTSPSNRISPGTIYRGAELLSTAFTDSPIAPSRHLIVVAASEPSDGSDGIQSLAPLDRATRWRELASKLSRENVHLHLILNPNCAAQEFVDLFYEVLAGQSCTESAPWFPFDHLNYNIYLSNQSTVPSNANQSTLSRNAAGLPYTGHTLPPAMLPPASTRPSMPRNNSYPQPTPRVSPPTKLDHPRPSIVTQLQKMHGLSKKRAPAPPRDPFIRDTDDPQVPFPSSPPANSSRASGPSSSSPPLPTQRSRRGTGGTNGGVAKKATRRVQTGGYSGTQPRIASPDSLSDTSAPSPSTVTTASPVLSLNPGYVASPTSPTHFPPSAFSSGEASEMVYPSAPLSDTVSPPAWVTASDPGQTAPTSAFAGRKSSLADGMDTFAAPRRASIAEVGPRPHANARVSPRSFPAHPGMRLSPPAQGPYPGAFPHPEMASQLPGQMKPSESIIPGGRMASASNGQMATTPPPPPSQADDGDKPFIFYPEYEDNARSMAPPAHPPPPAPMYQQQMQQRQHSMIAPPNYPPPRSHGFPSAPPPLPHEFSEAGNFPSLNLPPFHQQVGGGMVMGAGMGVQGYWGATEGGDGYGMMGSGMGMVMEGEYPAAVQGWPGYA